MKDYYDVTLTVRVTDARALLDAAVKRRLADIEGADKTETIREFGGTGADDEIDIDACLIEILDPGLAPEGLEILESRTEYLSALADPDEG